MNKENSVPKGLVDAELRNLKIYVDKLNNVPYQRKQSIKEEINRIQQEVESFDWSDIENDNVASMDVRDSYTAID